MPPPSLDIMTSSSSANSGKWFNKEYDALLAKAHDAKDPAERNRLYQQAEVLIDEEAPSPPVYFYVKSRLLKPNVKGLPLPEPARPGLCQGSLSDGAVTLGTEPKDRLEGGLFLLLFLTARHQASRAPLRTVTGLTSNCASSTPSGSCRHR